MRLPSFLNFEFIQEASHWVFARIFYNKFSTDPTHNFFSFLESIVFSFSPFSKSSLFVYMLNMSDGRFYKKYLQFEHTFCIIQKKHKLNLHGRFLQLLVLFDIYFVEAKKEKRVPIGLSFFTLFRVSHVRKYDEHSF